MTVEYSRKFLKDVQNVTDNKLKDQLFDAISVFKNAENLPDINNVKKLKAHSEAYRLRIGKYRLGFYYNGSVIEMERFVKRENIYKLFP